MYNLLGKKPTKTKEKNRIWDKNPQKMKTLLAITTYNHVDYTEKVEKSIPNIDGLDIVFIDDYSSDNTVDYLTSKGRDVITKEKGYGLTHSWNLAYKKFKHENYDAVIISNNDVLFNYTLKDLIDGLCIYNHEIVVPLTRRAGSGCSRQLQDVKHYYPNFGDENSPSKYVDHLDKLTNKEYRIIKWMHGFCFGFNRKIIECELDNENIFNPRNINCHQEADIYPRIKKHGMESRVCLSSFVFHFVNVSLPYKGIINGIDSRNLLDFNRTN